MSEDLVVLREILQRELETINAYEKMLERVSDPALREIIDQKNANTYPRCTSSSWIAIPSSGRVR